MDIGKYIYTGDGWHKILSVSDATIVGCGKNLYDVSDKRVFSDGVTVDADGWITVTADNSAGSSNIFKNCFTYPSPAIRPSTQYAVVCEIAQINVTGQLTFSIVDLYNDPQALSQFAQAFFLTVNESTQAGTRIQVLTSRADLSDAGSMLRTYVIFTPGASGTIKFRLSVLEDTSITAETFEYEPYQDIPYLSLDNAQGQVQSVAVEAGCRVKQSGTGDPSPTNIRAISGRESVEIVACGKNLVDLGDLYVSTSNVGMSLSGDSVRIYTTGDGGTWLGAHTPVFTIHAGVPYTLSATLDAYVSGNARIGLRGAENNTFLSGITLVFGSGTGSLSATFTPNADEEVYLSLLCTNDTTLSGDCTFSNIQLEIGSAATEYEPYRAMGGGTVTPTEPLYGLPGAEDTVEMSTDGDVTVTRRTGVKILTGTENWYTMGEWNPGSIAVLDILPDCKPVNDTSEVTTARCSHFPAYTANSVVHVISGDGFAINHGTGLYIRISGCETVDDCKAYLAAQYAAGTPVTIVYELAAPETEALTAISPIVPQPGQVNLFTDADALTATIHGSGWETVNDTTDLRDDLDDAQSDISSMLGSINTMRDNISSMSSQILSPDEIVTTVTESNEWQSQTTQITQNGEGLALVQVTVSDLGGRMDTMEGVIVIDPPNIDIGSSDSNTKLHLDNEGWDILSGGSATISARENKVVAPRFQVTDALMIGGLAFRVSNGHLYLLKNGG